MGNKDNNRFQGNNQNKGSNQNAQSADDQNQQGDQGNVNGSTADDAASQSGTDQVQSGGSAGGVPSGDQSSGTATASDAPANGTGNDAQSGSSQDDAATVSGDTALTPGEPTNLNPGVTLSPAAGDAVQGTAAAEVISTTDGVDVINVVQNDSFLQAGQAVSQMARGLVEEFETYVTNMNPAKPTSRAAGIYEQRRLLSVLKGIINNLDGDDFTIAFGILVKTIESQLNGVFDGLSVFRHLDAKDLNMSDTDRESFRSIVFFLTGMAPVQSRKVVAAQTNLDMVFRNATFTEEGRQRVEAFFNIR